MTKPWKGSHEKTVEAALRIFVDGQGRVWDSGDRMTDSKWTSPYRIQADFQYVKLDDNDIPRSVSLYEGWHGDRKKRFVWPYTLPIH